MASISSLGAGSGIFTNDLVKQLVEAERLPIEQRLSRRQSLVEAEISAFGKIRSAIEGLRTSMQELSKPEGMRAFTPNSSNDSVVSVTVDASKVSRGSYSVNVIQLAQTQSLASAAFPDRDTATLGEGTLTFTVGGVRKDVVIDSTNNTLEGVAAAINDAAVGATAGIVDTGSGFRLVLSADDSGTVNAVQVSVEDTDGNNTDSSGLSQFSFDGTTNNLQETVSAKDAILDVNGIQVTRPGNMVEGVVDGVAFDLKSTGISTVKVDRDPDAVAKRVQEFVDKFNVLQDEIRRFSGFNAETGRGGVLTGDATIRSIQSELRSMITSIPDGLQGSPIRMLADVGIKTDPSTGKLEFDQARFKEQLQANPDAMTALFTQPDAAQGIAERMVDTIDRFLASGGALSNRTSGLNKSIQEIQDQRDRLDMRIAAYEERLIKQFSAADALIAQIQSTGDYVSQQLAAIAPSPKSSAS